MAHFKYNLISSQSTREHMFVLIQQKQKPQPSLISFLCCYRQSHELACSAAGFSLHCRQVLLGLSKGISLKEDLPQQVCNTEQVSGNKEQAHHRIGASFPVCKMICVFSIQSMTMLKTGAQKQVFRIISITPVYFYYNTKDS